MAGKGPTPKRPVERARGVRGEAIRTFFVTVAPQPSLPQRMPDGALWPAQTRTWWKQWSRWPLATDFTELEWSELLLAAVLHGRFWSGDYKVASELRLRVAKFGVAADDRARLRIEFAEEAIPVPEPPRRRDPALLRLVEPDAVEA